MTGVSFDERPNEWALWRCAGKHDGRIGTMRADAFRQLYEPIDRPSAKLEVLTSEMYRNGSGPRDISAHPVARPRL